MGCFKINKKIRFLRNLHCHDFLGKCLRAHLFRGGVVYCFFQLHLYSQTDQHFSPVFLLDYYYLLLQFSSLDQSSLSKKNKIFPLEQQTWARWSHFLSYWSFYNCLSVRNDSSASFRFSWCSTSGFRSTLATLGDLSTHLSLFRKLQEQNFDNFWNFSRPRQNGAPSNPLHLWP